MIGPDEHYKVFDENAEIALKEVGDILKKTMPENYGFCFFMTSFGKGGNTFYVSNINREDMLDVLQEWIDDNKNG